MPTLFLGIVALVVVLWALSVASKADPGVASRIMKWGGGSLALVGAIFLGVRGELAVAIPLGVFALGLLGWLPLQTHFHRWTPGGRENPQGDAAAGRGAVGGGGKMTEKEAYQILGLQPGASAEEISNAHRNLMKKVHPDQGGSTYLAARVNEAKEILLRRHR
jgi:hypothetical protein